ncbi:WcaI family glycosyltransferase [Novosphingobium sp. 9U]|uniref:WcaI family glycosyltransferase n=1 Tax=Novosphingobium sp. 9U TaxID=2653158 RepID=UPI0012EFAA4E|nr:WcaI family glycosyltransferase [Novosphingobium sp. 9U]VWX53049.1 Colanic acid biosynthesis glycosyl transferase WcaI [Novosphingobium sp. 9U]
MNILVIGLNYAPEPVGIGPYTTGMAEALADAGHRVTVVCARPYYPSWSVPIAHRGRRARRYSEQGVTVVRLPIYVPAKPDGPRRLLHHLSFVAAAIPAVIAEARRRRPDVVVAVAPSLLSSVVARGAARLLGVPLWLHVQDFEVEAVFATGLLSGKSLLGGLLSRLAQGFERWSFGADRVSTISPQTCARLAGRGVALRKIIELRNWAAVDEIVPLSEASAYRAEWGIDRPHVAVYSGSIANKQGLGLIVAAAQRLQHRRDLAFVICGEGPQRAAIMAAAAGLDNIQFHALQPRERLSDLLGLASVHLLPQIAGAADLLLPSKLTNMLASGRPVVATAASGTGLAQEVEGCGIVTAPGNADAFAAAIERLVDDPQLGARLGQEGRRRAEERWSQSQILGRFERQLRELVA